MSISRRDAVVLRPLSKAWEGCFHPLELGMLQGIFYLGPTLFTLFSSSLDRRIWCTESEKTGLGVG